MNQNKLLVLSLKDEIEHSKLVNRVEGKAKSGVHIKILLHAEKYKYTRILMHTTKLHYDNFDASASDPKTVKEHC